MSALPENIIPFELPKRKPRVVQQDAPPDQRKVAVIPIRACTDRRLTEGMIRALILMCSYCNRAGITWVSQKLLAERLGVSQQAVSKHLVKLQAAGYLEIHKRAVPGERHTTWRVIFDPSIKVEDAVAITSAIEDTRPPTHRPDGRQGPEETRNQEGVCNAQIRRNQSGQTDQGGQPEGAQEAHSDTTSRGCTTGTTSDCG